MKRNRLVRLGIIVVCLYLIVTTAASLVDLWRAGDKLTSREENLAALQAEGRDLQRQKNEVESGNYLERIARDELGMSKPGEQVLIIPQDLLAVGEQTATPDATPNWQKWVRLLL